jgi:hypothetical protein
VREYKAAMANIVGTAWRSDLETRKITWEGKGVFKSKRKAYVRKRKMDKSRLVKVDLDGVRHAMQGQN